MRQHRLPDAILLDHLQLWRSRLTSCRLDMRKPGMRPACLLRQRQPALYRHLTAICGAYISLWASAPFLQGQCHKN